MQVHTENELMVTRGERWEEGRVREFGMDLYTHTTVFKMDDPQGLRYSAGNSHKDCCIAQETLLNVIWQPG